MTNSLVRMQIPEFQSLALVQTPYQLEWRPYVNCNRTAIPEIQQQISSITREINDNMQIGYQLGRCLRIGTDYIRGKIISVAQCLRLQTAEKTTLKICSKAMTLQQQANDEIQRLDKLRYDQVQALSPLYKKAFVALDEATNAQRACDAATINLVNNDGLCATRPPVATKYQQTPNHPICGESSDQRLFSAVIPSVTLPGNGVICTETLHEMIDYVDRERGGFKREKLEEMEPE